MALLWLYCKAWGAHGIHILAYNGLWKFHRDNLREVLFDLSFQDPDEVPAWLSASNDLVNLLKEKLNSDDKNLIDWLNSTFKQSLELIPKRKS